MPVLLMFAREELSCLSCDVGPDFGGVNRSRWPSGRKRAAMVALVEVGCGSERVGEHPQ